MLADLKKLSGFFFYTLGCVTLFALVSLKRGWSPSFAMSMLSSIDLPLILTAMLYGGSSFYLSLKRDGSWSLPLALAIGVPLGLLFLLFAYMDLWLPFSNG